MKKVAKLGHGINRNFKIGCMIAYMCTYPNTCNPDDILLAQKKDQISNMLCGDVQVRDTTQALQHVILRKIE
jgi:6-phospho-beta-glucosidase